jgi:4-oxalomesaconate tautomerase
LIDYNLTVDGIYLRSAGLVRTARLLARGEVMIPRKVWSKR